MLNYLKQESNFTATENGALTHTSSQSDCLDLFFRSGGMREADRGEIETVVLRAYAENPLTAMRILFYIRDVRGGLGERRFFRIAMETLAAHAPDAVRRNIGLFAEYGRFDDLCVLLGTACEPDALRVIAQQLREDYAAMEAGKPASLLAKWLPSVNASSAKTCAAGKRIARAMHMTEKQYRKMLSALRQYTDIIENRLRVSDYTFRYEAQTSGAMFKYRKAFIRNDETRYTEYLNAVQKGEATMHAGTLYPYEIVQRCLRFGARQPLTAEERLSLDTAWKSLPAYGSGSENALAVIDGSGSMYRQTSPSPISAALSLGIYFAEHNRGAFANHFITFSARPQLVEIKGQDIFEKVQYCARYHEVANTDLEAVFLLILRTAVRNRLPQSEMPAKLFIISDMEFDFCVTGGNQMTLFDAMQKLYRQNGYTLPQIVFWNVASRQENIPVTRSQTGAALVSGASPSVFDVVINGKTTPEAIMYSVVERERYMKIS